MIKALKKFLQRSAFALVATGIATTAYAGPPFQCDGNIYQVQSGQLRIFDPITSTYQNIGPQNGSYNATGFNILDNYAYASQGGNIIRISADGTIETVFNIGFGSFSGDVDFSNNYWLRRNNSRYARIDLATGNIVNVDFTGSGGGPADVAYDQFGGEEFLIGFGGGRIFRYNITNQTRENFVVPGLPGGGFGATWTDSNGRLFTFNNNNGLLYEVFDYFSNTPTVQQVGVGEPSGNNDGFSCSLAPFPNLAPVAFDDNFTTPINTAFSGNVIADNGNGADNDPDGTPVTVNTTPLSGPSNGVVVLSPNGDFTYTPDADFFGTDVFEYEITDAAGLTATAFVFITVVANPDYEITKTQTAGPANVTAAGQLLTYSIEVANTGNAPLTDIMVSDTLPDGSAATLSGPTESGAATNVPGRLDVSETWTYTTTYTTTQDDIDAGGILVNEAAATTEETGPLPRRDTAETPITQNPLLSIVKDVDPDVLGMPDTLTYTITVDNIGNQSLTGVSLTDVLLQNGGALPLSSGPTLAGDTDGDAEIDVDETWVYTATFDAEQAQLDLGADIVNTATIQTDQTGPQSDDAVTSIGQTPSFMVDKTSNTAILTTPGTIAYQIEVENTGNVSITGVTPTDTVTQGAATLALTSGLDLSGDTDGDNQIDPDETWVYTGTYVAGQDQIDNGAPIVNDISVATSNAGTQTGQTSTSIGQTPSFLINKSVNETTITAPGVLSFEVVVQNTGNVSLTGVNLTDTLTQGAPLGFTSGPTLSGDTNNDTVLDVGETWVYVSTFAVDQLQIDDGGNIVNNAQIDTDQTGPQSAQTTTEITQTDAIALLKDIAPGEPSSFSAVGDTVDFLFSITNTGNTTLQQPITIDDDQIGNGLACLTTDLAPGASATCLQTWTADLDDLNAGSVTNVASAVDDNGTRSADQQETVTAVQDPSLSIVKAIVPPVPTVFASGQTLFYEYLVTNTGNVTLTEMIDVVDNLTSVSCPGLPGGALIPGDAITCTANYVLTSNDEELGSTTNVARAETTFDGAPVVSPSDTAIFPVAASPVIDLQKSAPAGLIIDDTTDTITYSYRIENVPPPAPAIGAALTEVIFINDNKFVDPIVCYDPDAPSAADPNVLNGSFQPGEVFICTAEYTVTQDDLDAGVVENEATANTIFAPSSPNPIDVTSNIATESVPVATAPGLGVVKTVTGGPDPAAVGQTIDYEIVATNTGNQTLNTVALSDPALGALTCDVPAPVTLLPGEALTCDGSYVVQQSDLDAQTVGDGDTAIFTNTATGSANDPAGVAIPPVDGSVDHPLTPAAPSVAVLKELFPVPGADPAYTAVDDVVRFRIRVTNDGTMTLSSIDVTDSLVAGTCTVGPLAPGETDGTCIFDYTVQQADIDRGFIENVGSASAQPIDPAADPVLGDDTLTSDGPAFAGALEVIKAGSLDLGADGIATVGDVISYTITVRNTGNVSLTNTVVTDPGADQITVAAANDPDGDNDIDTLAPGDVATATATRALTQDDINAGSFANTATATGQDPAGDDVSDASDSADPADGPGGDDPTVTPIPRGPGLSVDKSFTAVNGTGAGDTITYSYLVQNTGNVTLTNVTLTDDHTSASGTATLPLSGGGVIATLLPGATATLTATYVVTQEDVDAGDTLTNIVTATGNGPAGTPAATDSDTEAADVEASDPDLEVIKTVRSQSGSAEGDVVVFEVALQNTGNVSLSNIAVTDNLSRADNTVVTPAPTPAFESGDGGLPGQIDVGETWVYTVSYTLTQDDIDAGGIRNSATGFGDAPDGTMVSDVSDNGAGGGSSPTLVPITAMPALEAVKTITSSTIVVGQTVTFEIAVENTGNVTLSSVNIASDTLTRADGTPLSLTGPTFSGADMGSPEGALMVGETATYSASYVLVQDDIDAGGIENTATAQGTPPIGSPVSDVSDDAGPGSDPTVLTIPADPQIDLEKRLIGGGPSFDAVDDVLEYAFEITNLGNVTLSAPYDVADPLITDAGGTISCPTTDLAPGASLTCTGNYSVTQEDLDAGQVDNTATATVGDADPVDASETVPAVQTPELDMIKTPDLIEAEDFIVGAVVTYTFTTTNTGNVTITDAITIDDSLIDPADISCDPFPTNGLAPGDSYECTGSYTVTTDDVQIAVVTNLATASAGPTTSPIASATIPNDGVPALTLDKELITSRQPDGTDTGGTTFDEVGDQLEYRFTVTNTGQVSFANDITVTDTYFTDPIVCYVPDASNPDLTPGESIDCTATYPVTQDDLDAGAVVNEAFARTEFGSIPTIVQSTPDTETTLVDADPMVSILKEADRTDFAAIDEVVTYDFTVTNTGNQTLTSVMVSDPLIPGLICEAATLAVDEVLTCSAPYTITQADIDRGFVTNSATASGIDPTGAGIPPVAGDVTIDGPSVPPTLDLAKIANPDPFGGVGTAIAYTFAVTNTSIYTLSDITVTDFLPGEALPFTCDIATLAPGAVDQSCQVVIEVTQAMVDDGELENTATAEGQDPFGNTAEATDTIVTDGPDEDPSLNATKLANVPATTLGTQITFTLVLENTGNVTIAAVVLTDTMLRNDGTPLSLDGPFVRLSGDTNADNRIQPTETWTFEAPYTITQDDINAGGFSNIVDVQGLSPSGATVTDRADNGDDSDGNTTDDPTMVPITTDPVLNVTKTITTTGAMPGDEVIFEIQAANTGNVDIFNATPTDTLTRSDGTDLTADITGPTRTVNPTDAGDTTLSPGEYWSWEVAYTLTQDDIDAGGISNVASVTGEDIGGESVTDIADNGDDGDGNITDDPTVLLIPATPAIEAVKTVTELGEAAGDLAEFTVVVTNTGNVTLSDLTLADTMTNLAGDPIDPADFTVSDPGVASLGVGAEAIYTIRYTLTQADVDAGGLSNTATATGTTPGGLDLSDISDDGDDTDGNTFDDPTLALIAANGSLVAAKSAELPTRIGPDLFEVTFTMTISNTGNVTLTDLAAEDGLLPFLGSAELVQVNEPVVSGFTTGAANPLYDGIDTINMLTDGATLAPGLTGTILLTLQYNTQSGPLGGTNTLVVSSNETPEQAVAVASISDVAPADVLATKTATPSSALLGDTITYTLTFLNRLETAEENLTVIDELPAGIVYTPGTAVVDDVALEPVINGRRLEWSPLALAQNGTITITFDARLATGTPGEYVNRTWAQDAGGNVVSNVATATVARRPEAVFDCADIIGKVFDDRNQNGYQDGIEEDRAAITVQDYFSDKFERPEGPKGEPGLPGVRLATVDGTLITTDEFGRFSVPCAELPAAIGSNFQLKLDERTLPTGYNVTTENPRNVRVTPGRMTRLNFGATLSNLVEIDLTAAAFNGSAMNGDLQAYLPVIVRELSKEASILRLTYYRNGEDPGLANARLDTLETALRQLWAQSNRPRLTIERTMHRVQ